MLIYTGFHPLTVIILVLITIFTNPVQAVPSMGMGYEPRYPADFKHFDYVNPDAPKGGKLVLAGTGAFDGFNPYILKGGNSAEGLNLVFESLMVSSLDEPFSKYPLIAEDIRLAKDRMSVQFKINKKARFSNGDVITAHDVKFSFDTLLSKQAHPVYRFTYGDVKQAVVIGKYTIRFDFKQLNPELHLILGDFPVFSKKWLGDKSFDKLSEEIPIASGPYTIGKYSLGKQLVFQRDPNYWAADLPSRKGMFNFEQIVYKYYQDLVISLEAFKAGEFDFRFEYYSKLWAREHEGPNYESGKIVKELLPHKNNAGMQGFIFNTRREIFKDPRVRQAIALGFDFEWSNDHLFYNQYVVNDSYFSNTELAASGVPKGEELKLLQPYRNQLSEAVFNQPWQPISTHPPMSLRKNLRKAKKMLEDAGWKLNDGVLVNKDGLALEYQVMLAQKGMDRILAPFARNLAKLGIKMTYRKVDRSLYIRRVREFDFDMVVGSFSQSLSPGNEQLNMFHSRSAKQVGSRNLPGIDNPVVDAMVEKVISASDRKELITACHALDRVLLNGHYLVANWYINTHRIAHWDKFERPSQLPLYYTPISWMTESWWMKQ